MEKDTGPDQPFSPETATEWDAAETTRRPLFVRILVLVAISLLLCGVYFWTASATR